MATKKQAATPRKKRTPSAPADETKAAKFIRLGEARVNKAVKAIEVIGNLSGGSYEYTAAQVAVIRESLNSAVSDTMDRFQPKSAKAERHVSLSVAAAAQ